MRDHEGRGPDWWRFQCFGTHGNVQRVIRERPRVKVVEWPLPIFDAFDESRQFDYRSGCADLDLTEPAFVPERDAQFTLLADIPHPAETTELSGHPADAKLQILVVRDVRVVPPRALIPDPIDGQVFRWPDPASAAQWEENFSDRVRVNEVRVVSMGQTPAGASVPLASVELQNGPRCYADAEGTVTLRRCRLMPDPADPGTPVEATPTYVATLPRQRAIWTVRLAQPAADRNLGIEFTLEVKP